MIKFLAFALQLLSLTAYLHIQSQLLVTPIFCLQTGILSGLPHVLRMIFSYYFSVISDWLIRTKKMTLTNVRKLATFVCTGVQGVFILGLGYSGCHPILAVIFMMAGTAVNGACSASTLANFVDLSPNYASVLLGFCGMIVIWSGFISPAVVGVLTNNNVSNRHLLMISLFHNNKSIAHNRRFVTIFMEKNSSCAANCNTVAFSFHDSRC